MQRQTRYNDNTRLEQLKTILAHPDQANRNGQPLLGPKQLEETRRLAETIESRLGERNAAQITRREAISKRDKQRDRIISLIRASWNYLEAMIQSGFVDETSFARYGLGATGRRPQPSTTRGWLNAAKPLIEETEIEISVIDKETFTAEIEATRALEIEAETATARLRERQADLKRIRLQIDEHLRGTARAIRAVLHGESAVDQRNAMRILGYRFLNDPSQTEPESISET